MVEAVLADISDMKGSGKSRFKLVEYFPHLLAIVGLSVLFVAVNNKSKGKPDSDEGASQQSSLQRPHQERVNRYLKEAFTRKQLEALKTSKDLGKDASQIQPSTPIKPFDSRESYSGAEIEVPGDYAEPQQSAYPLSPEEQIQLQLKRSQEEQYRTRAEQEQFVREFVENARKSGIDIRIDPETLKVLSVRKLTPR